MGKTQILGEKTAEGAVGDEGDEAIELDKKDEDEDDGDGDEDSVVPGTNDEDEEPDYRYCGMSAKSLELFIYYPWFMKVDDRKPKKEYVVF